MNQRIELDEAELHTPLFLGRKNWGLKLQRRSAKGTLEMAYDRDLKELLVQHAGAIAIIPISNVAWMAPMPTMKAEEPVEEVAQEPRRPGRPSKVQAQVGGPTDHVHKGMGAGKRNE